MAEGGEALAEVYSPELYQAIQELLLNQSTLRKRAGDADDARPLGLGRFRRELVRLSGEKLKLWGITQRRSTKSSVKEGGLPPPPSLRPSAGWSSEKCGRRGIRQRRSDLV